nr:hypothetical protein [Chromatiaceae bacterium]
MTRYPLTARQAGWARRRPARLLAAALFPLSLALLAPAASASDFSSQDYLSGNWGGARDRWQAQGLEARLNYTAEPLA